MSTWAPIAAGTILNGRYEIQEVSGRGGFGATYRVSDRDRFGQSCALKELLPHQAENPKARELFEREARTLLGLRHAGIPSFHAFFFHDDRYYLVEDFIQGRTLARELEEKGRFSEAEVVAVLDEVLSILEYLHGRTPAVVHRDIKPANLIRATSGSLYLVDFGAVKEAVVATTVSEESTIIGTSGYTPPEQLRGLVVPASDLYALGAMALQLLSGRPPAEWFNLMDGTWRFAGQLGATGRLEGILARLLENQLSRRFQSATVVREALRGGGSTAEAARVTSAAMSAPALARAHARWRGWLVGASAAVVVVVAGVAAFTMLGPRTGRSVPAAPPAAPVAGPAAVVPPAPSAATPSPSQAAPPVPVTSRAEVVPRAPGSTTASAGAPPSPSAAPGPSATSAKIPGAEAPDRGAARNDPRAADARRPPAPAESQSRVSSPPRVAEAPRVAEPRTAVSPPEPPRQAESRPTAPEPRAEPAAEPALGARAAALPPVTPPTAPAPPPSLPGVTLPHRVFPAPLDRVWSMAEGVLKSRGWDLDKRDRSAGLIVTGSRVLEGEDIVVAAKEVRHRLRVQFKPAAGDHTLVTVERLVFRRKRIAFVTDDEPMELPEHMRKHELEQDVLAAMGRGL
jgi:hypothetical protein